MTRTTAAVDRVATFVVALLLLAFGLLLIIWRLGRWLELPSTLNTSTVTDQMQLSWWPIALIAAGIVLALLGLRWLWAHLATTGVREVSVPGSGKSGQLSLDAKAAASAAADVLADSPGVRQARGKAVRQRGQLLLDLRATVDADADLAEISRSADRVSSELAQVFERPDIHCRMRVDVASRAGGRRLG